LQDDLDIISTKKGVFIYRYLTVLITIFFIGCDTPKAKNANCAYSSNPDIHEFTSQGECGKFIDKDTFVLYPEHFKNLNFADSNYTTLYAKNGKDGERCVFYVSKSGKIVRTFFFDNGADHFEEGLARTISKKKFGFINSELEVIIEPKFDFAYPFENGKARVCNGCTKKQEGEHYQMVGGEWGVIDKSGKLIYPLK
jgi:hypothetical protein